MTEKPDAANLLSDQKVRAYIDLVYASAMRRLHDDADRAADVTQAVMLVMLRKAREGKLPPEKLMAGWLIKITGYAVMQMDRSAARRTRHESHAARNMPQQSSDSFLYADIREALDESLLKLKEIDREVVIRRCLQGQTLAEIGQALTMNENTVGKRVARALPKLRHLLSRRGIAAPTAAVATVLAAEQLIKAPASAMTPSAAPAIGALAKNLSWKIAMVKAKATALASLAILLFLSGGTAIFMKFGLPATTPAIAASPASTPTTLPWPSTQPTITVTRVIDGPSDAILNEVLTGLRENKAKLHTIHVHAIFVIRDYDSERKSWDDARRSEGEAWLEAGESRRFRAEVTRDSSRAVTDSGELGPVENSSYIETWDGITTRREKVPPLSVQSGTTFDRRRLEVLGLAGSDFSMQLAWDEEGSSDAKGWHTTIDRYPLAPATLAQMKLSARRVVLGANQIAMELTVHIPDPQITRIETFWFDPQRGYALLARRNTLSIDNREEMNQTYVIESLAEAAPGIFYPTKAQLYWVSNDTPVIWEIFVATQVTANEPVNATTFALNFSPGIDIYDFKNGRGTKRPPATAPH